MPKPKTKTTHKPARKRPRRKPGWERLCAENEAHIVKQLISEKEGTEFTRAALASLLIELSNATGV
jgi:hypothetical protein